MSKLTGVSPTKGATPMAKDTVAVRGVANRGPMQGYTATPRQCGGLAQGAVSAGMPPPTRAKATTVSSGRPTPVSKKPRAMRPQLISGRQPDHGRKNDVASPEEGKSHKSKGQNVPEMGFFVVMMGAIVTKINCTYWFLGALKNDVWRILKFIDCFAFCA